MVKRNLIKNEKDISEKQFKKHQQNIIDLEQNLGYNQDLIKRQVDQRTHEDKWRQFLRDKKDKEDQEVLKLIKMEIENSKEHVKILSDQLKNGVEVKKVNTMTA